LFAEQVPPPNNVTHPSANSAPFKRETPAMQWFVAAADAGRYCPE
jgi:hypothetical protein